MCLLLWRNCLFGPEWASWNQFELNISVWEKETHLVLTSSSRHSRTQCLSVDWPTGLLLEQRLMSRWPGHSFTALSAKRKFFFFHIGASEIPKLQQHLYYFHLILLGPSLPLVHSKQKTEEVRRKINSTQKKSKAQLNWIELKCNQRTNTVYLMFSDNRLTLEFGGHSNTWKHGRLNFSLSLSQY